MSETERTTGDQAHLQLPNPWLKATYQTIWWFLSQPQFAGWVQSDPHTEQKLVVKNLNASETKGFPQGTGSTTLYFPKQTCCQVSSQAHPCVGVAWATAEDKMWTSPSQWNGSRNPPNLFVIRSLIVCTYTHHTSATALLHIFSMSGTAGRTSFAVAAPVQRAAAKTVAYLSPQSCLCMAQTQVRWAESWLWGGSTWFSRLIVRDYSFIWFPLLEEKSKWNLRALWQPALYNPTSCSPQQFLAASVRF